MDQGYGFNNGAMSGNGGWSDQAPSTASHQNQQHHYPSAGMMNGHHQQDAAAAPANDVFDPLNNNSLSSMENPLDNDDSASELGLRHSFASSTHGPRHSFASTVEPQDQPVEDNHYNNDQQTYDQQQQVQQPVNELTSPTTTQVPNPVSNTATPQSNDDNGQQKRPAAEAAPRQDDDDDDDDDSVIEIIDSPSPQKQPTQNKRQRYVTNTGAVAIQPPSIGTTNSYQSRAAWVNQQAAAAAAPGAAASYGGHAINPGQSLNGYNPYSNNAAYSTAPYSHAQQPPPPPQQQYASAPSPWEASMMKYDQPQYVDMPSEFVPTWKKLIPDTLVAPQQQYNQKKAFSLSLINLSEFTITGLQVDYSSPPTPIAGLRAVIKRISREHGQATFEKDGGEAGTGRWKIPLGAYHAFVAYLKSDPNCVQVEQIPQMQLKIASLGKARMERDYPSAEKLQQRGVPSALANTLAPFQRGGVDFVLEREGRALIADEMGLGKTIQSIASMSVYHQEWPLLVLTPSGARYHWESEFKNWLGENGAAVKKAQEMAHLEEDQKPRASVGNVLGGRNKPFNLLRDSQIHVLTSSKGPVLPNKNVRIVICSYGLAPMLAENRQILPGLFGCAIADESHMLKNSKSKRTKFLLPILKACKRCILLSGTPALAKPLELWPQLQILASERGYWDDEDDFIKKYVKNVNASRRSELHTMLTGTLMIRRLKDDILKDMPKKAREKAILEVESAQMRSKMQECMVLLRQGKGVMAKLARQHSALPDVSALEEKEEPAPSSDANNSPEHIAHSLQLLLNGQRQITTSNPEEMALEQEMCSRYQQGQMTLQHTIRTSPHQLSQEEIRNFMGHRDHRLRNELQVEYQERLLGMRDAQRAQEESEKPSRATVLNKMYSLTGESKIPLVSNFLAKWLADPAKGKICVFAHHITVLDAIAERVGLCNSGKPNTFKFIRIDGKTSPRSRQEQIDKFQTDPSVRVALLGITAAGVAVTLTASSHVLFAELFWTPALMIQAEDRCHRIGQRARVHCKYFVASGTLDEILWKLIEKKFRELGEFVEGKEKLKMIVHKVYHNEEELNKIFEYEDEDEDDDDDILQADQVESSSANLIPLDMDLEHDIEELGKEEQAMALGDRDDDDPDPDPMSSIEAPQSSTTPTVVDETGPGRSEEDAIALSDDDEDDDEVEAAAPLAVDIQKPDADLNVDGSLPDCKMYKMVLRGQLGVEIGHYKDRLIVSKKKSESERIKRLGEDCKPDVGDVLVAVDNQILPPITNLKPALDYLKKMLHRGQPSTFWFAEDGNLKEFYKKVIPADDGRKRPRNRAPKRPPPKPEEVVELLDD